MIKTKTNMKKANWFKCLMHKTFVQADILTEEQKSMVKIFLNTLSKPCLMEIYETEEETVRYLEYNGVIIRLKKSSIHVSSKECNSHINLPEAICDRLRKRFIFKGNRRSMVFDKHIETNTMNILNSIIKDIKK